MWIMTSIGFYSAVQDKHDDQQLIIRARCKADVFALAKYLPSDEAHKPVHGAGTDYPWRLTCLKTEWAQVMVTLTIGIDYGNFKGSIKSKKHHDAYMRVWQDLLALEDRPEPMTRQKLAHADFRAWLTWWTMENGLNDQIPDDALCAMYDDRLTAWDEDHAPRAPLTAKSVLAGSKKRKKA